MKGWALLFALVCFVSDVKGQSWLLAPKPRNGGSENTILPCDFRIGRKQYFAIQQGQSLPVTWADNAESGNHTFYLEVDEDELETSKNLIATFGASKGEIGEGTLAIPEDTAPGVYVLQYRWRHYRSCVDLLVIPMSAGSSSLLSSNPTSFNYKCENGTTLVREGDYWACEQRNSHADILGTVVILLVAVALIRSIFHQYKTTFISSEAVQKDAENGYTSLPCSDPAPDVPIIHSPTLTYPNLHSAYMLPASAPPVNSDQLALTVSNRKQKSRPSSSSSSKNSKSIRRRATSQWVAVPLITQASRNAGNTGGEGCQVPQNIAIDPTGDFLIFGTDVGGIWKSTDGGSNWQPANVGYTPRGGCSFAIDPVNTNRIIAVGCNSGAQSVNGLYISTDKACSWTPVFLQSIQGSGTYHDSVCFDPTSGGGGYCTIAYYVSYSEAGGGLYKSTDGGNTWTQIQSNFSNGIVKVSPNDGTVYVATSNGFYRSTNGGSTFTQIVSGSVLGLDVVVTEPTNVYINNASGVMISTDSGQTFTTPTNTGLPSGYTPGLRNVKVSPANTQYMLLDNDTGNYSDQGYYYSHNGGTSWSTSSVNSTQSFIPYNEREHLFAWHPTNSSNCWSFGGDFITTSTDGGVTFYWNSNGYNALTFVGYFNFNPSNPDLLVLTSQDYDASFTQDGGNTWTWLNASGLGWGGYTYGGFALSSSVLVVGVAPGWGETSKLYISTNGGSTWTNTGNAGNGLDVACGDPASSTTCFWDNWCTNDGGTTWTAMTNCNGVYTYNPTGSMELYGAKNAEVVKSTNHGSTWTNVCSVGSVAVTDIAFDWVRNRLYIANGVLYCYDVGTSTLTNLSSRLGWDNNGVQTVTTVCVDPAEPSIVYAGWHGDTYATSLAVRRSVDGGMTWEPLTLQAGDTGIDGGHEAYCVRVHPTTRYLWVGGECYGIWKHPPPS